MRTVFVVRPFGVAKDARGVEIDFDRVHRELIAPAIKRVGLIGGTTEQIIRSGNIRADMFELLAKADLVIGDLSIHNANVFYELGIRHALRDKRAFLIRCRADEVPFDLKTDRYLAYDRNDPGANLDALVEGLERTLASDVVDSPIFQLVPALQPQDAQHLITVPRDFSEDVRVAEENNWSGDLELMALETRGFGWGDGGLRLIGRAQFHLKAWEGARETWESVRGDFPDDCEANLKLGTIYQRLDDLPRSDTAIERVINNAYLTLEQRAEAFALLGSNEKTRWRDVWETTQDAEKPRLALGSGYLGTAQRYYRQGFLSDLNHFYSGVNALALSVVLTELAKAYPETWSHNYDTPQEAQFALDRLLKERVHLEGAVSLSVERHLQEQERVGKPDRWALITQAATKLLTGAPSGRVETAFREAFEGAKSFFFESECRQLQLLRKLGVLRERVEAVITTLQDVSGDTQICEADDVQIDSKHVLLFTGHRIDEPGRPVPRFPQHQEGAVRDAIKIAIERATEGFKPKDVMGIAGGASGGDILFHELCDELGITTRLFLAVDPDLYIDESVRVTGSPQWVDRFRQIESRCETRVLCPEGKLPAWLDTPDDHYVWVRNNLWTLHSALAYGGKNVTLIALWDGKKGDGPGGTGHMVNEAKSRGAKITILDEVLSIQ